MWLQGEDCHIHRDAEQQVNFETFLQLGGGGEMLPPMCEACAIYHAQPRRPSLLVSTLSNMLLAHANNMT